MNVYLAADHRGFELKETVKEWLADKEAFEVIDLGAKRYVKTDDYPDYGIALGEAVAGDPGSKGIGICGSGVGMVIAANKVNGVRAGQARDAEIAAVSCSDDSTNVLAVAADYIYEDKAKRVIETWLGCEFAGEARFMRRIKKLEEYEKKRG